MDGRQRRELRQFGTARRRRHHATPDNEKLK
jgi:hypothetical protein